MSRSCIQCKAAHLVFDNPLYIVSPPETLLCIWILCVCIVCHCVLLDKKCFCGCSCKKPGAAGWQALYVLCPQYEADHACCTTRVRLVPSSACNKSAHTRPEVTEYSRYEDCLQLVPGTQISDRSGNVAVRTALELHDGCMLCRCTAPTIYAESIPECRSLSCMLILIHILW